jgi:hypothetical protein
MRPQGRREALLLAVLEMQNRNVHPLRRVGIGFRACTALNRHYRPLLKKPDGDKVLKRSERRQLDAEVPYDVWLGYDQQKF